MNIIQQFEAEQIARLTRDPRRAGLRARRHAARRGEGGRGRAHPHPGLRGRLHRALQQGAEQQLHRAQDQLWRGRGARVPALLADDRGDRGGAPRRRAPRQAVLPARPLRQVAPASPNARARPGPLPREAPADERNRSRPTEHRVHDGGRERMSEAKPRTLFDKIWDSHVVEQLPDGTCILYIDRHLVHEVTSPQAFEGLRLAGRKLRRPDADDRGRRPQHPDRRRPHAVRHQGGGQPHPGRDAGAATSPSSACPTSRSSTCARASCTSSARSWASACRA